MDLHNLCRSLKYTQSRKTLESRNNYGEYPDTYIIGNTCILSNLAYKTALRLIATDLDINALLQLDIEV